MLRLLTRGTCLMLLVLTGCSTVSRKTTAPPVAPTVPVATTPLPKQEEPAGKSPAAEPAAMEPGVPAVVAPEMPRLPEGEYAITVETEPAGAMIVVNGIPVGRAPRRVLVSGTAQGFARSPVTVRARFLASDSSQQSASVEVELTTLDRIPAVLHFTPEKATRRW
jgi:hypothetical protein